MAMQYKINEGCPVCEETKLTLEFIPYFAKVYLSDSVREKYKTSAQLYHTKVKTIKAIKQCSACQIMSVKTLDSEKAFNKITKMIHTIEDESQIDTLSQYLQETFDQYMKPANLIHGEFDSLSEMSQRAYIYELSAKRLRYLKKFDNNLDNYDKGLTVTDVEMMGNLQIGWSSSYGFGNLYLNGKYNESRENNITLETEHMSKEFAVAVLRKVIALAEMEDSKKSDSFLLLKEKCDRIKIQLADAILSNQPVGKINKLKNKIKNYQAIIEKGTSDE